MAKGQGKGQGKGKDGNESCCSKVCGCICCLVFLPIIFIALGLLFMVGKNTRVTDIKNYNEDAPKWTSYVDDFSRTSFTANGQLMDQITWSSGKYYPVRDSCDKSGDPEGGCVSAKVLYYSVNTLYFGGHLTVSNSQGETIHDGSYSSTQVTTYTKSQLSCTSDSSKCTEKCRDKGGVFSGNVCRVTYYLNKLSVRVAKSGSSYNLDRSPVYSFLPSSSFGCYHSNNYGVASYSSTASSSVVIEVRHGADAYIVADYYTGGCSSKSTNDNSCFGLSQTEQTVLGVVLFIIGAIILIAYVAIAIVICTCCKSSFKNKYGNKLHPTATNSSQIQSNMNNGTIAPAPTNYATQSYPTAQPINSSIPVAQTYNNYPVAQPYNNNNNYIPTAQVYNNGAVPGAVPSNQY
ncbi:hypothetical protein WA158_006175 [Blastocystis sp. Blastoise]